MVSDPGEFGMEFSSGVPAAWHPDPYGGASHRWWDGRLWSDDTGPAEPQYGLAPMKGVAGQTLFLHQKLGAGLDELCLGQTRIGLMQKPWIGDVTIHSAEGSWLLDRQGLTQNTLSIRVLPDNAEIARFAWDGVVSGGNGQLTFADGRYFSLVRIQAIHAKLWPVVGITASPSSGAWSLRAGSGEDLVTSWLAWPQQGRKLRGGSVRTAADLWTHVHEPAGSLRELPLLVLLAANLAWWSGTQRETRGGFGSY